MENRGAFGSRSPNDASVRKMDWNCLHCGNLNFSFRNVCNRGTCGAPRRPPSPIQRMMAAPTGGVYDQSSTFYGCAGATRRSTSPIPRMMPTPTGGGYDQSAIFDGSGPSPHITFGSASYGASYPHIGLPYGYGLPVGPVGGSTGGLSRSQMTVSVIPQGSPILLSSPWFGGAFEESDDTTASQKRQGGPGGLAKIDWKCHTCGNINYSFRNTCNMKNCGAPRPTPWS